MPTSYLVSCFVALTFAVASAHAQSDCSLVYGSDCAFVFSTPAKWLSVCQAERLVGAPVALWPVGSTFAESAAVMYVNVSSKDERSLPEFAGLSRASSIVCTHGRDSVEMKMSEAGLTIALAFP